MHFHAQAAASIFKAMVQGCGLTELMKDCHPVTSAWCMEVPYYQCPLWDLGKVAKQNLNALDCVIHLSY